MEVRSEYLESAILKVLSLRFFQTVAIVSALVFPGRSFGDATYKGGGSDHSITIKEYGSGVIIPSVSLVCGPIVVQASSLWADSFSSSWSSFYLQNYEGTYQSVNYSASITASGVSELVYGIPAFKGTIRGYSYNKLTNHRNENSTEFTAFIDPPRVIAPKGVAASDGLYADKVRVTWSKIADEPSYRVYRATSSGGSKTAVSGWIAGTSFDDTTAIPGSTYYYWVQASLYSGTDFLYAGDYSSHAVGVRKAISGSLTGFFWDEVKDEDHDGYACERRLNFSTELSDAAGIRFKILHRTEGGDWTTYFENSGDLQAAAGVYKWQLGSIGSSGLSRGEYDWKVELYQGTALLAAESTHPHLTGQKFETQEEDLPVSEIIVENGSGSGVYPHGHSVQVVANAPPEGSVFVSWETVPSEYAEALEDASASTTMFVVPNENVTLKARYKFLHQVIFDLGLYGSRTGGGELIQNVIDGNSAEEPEVDSGEGWMFAGWDRMFDHVTSALHVTANFVRVKSVRSGHKVQAADGAAGNGFGSSTAISGNLAVIGGPNWSGGAGGVYVFERNASGQWGFQTKLGSAGGEEGNQFGESVAMDGTTIAVGMPGYNAGELSGAGAVCVFIRTAGGVWSQQAKLSASDPSDEFDGFGKSVALCGDTLLIGTENRDCVYVFVRDGAGVWTEVQKLTAFDDTYEKEYFGYSVALSGENALIGSYGDNPHGDFSGSAHAFRRDGSGVWQQISKLTASDAAAGDCFGLSVALDGEIAVVGAPYDSENGGGRAYVYVLNDEELWSLSGILRVNGGKMEDDFGGAVAIQKGNVLIGASFESGRGAAYLFTRNNMGQWTPAVRFCPADLGEWDFFGTAVALYGDTVIAGAMLNDDQGEDSGVAYIFDITEILNPVLCTVRIAVQQNGQVDPAGPGPFAKGFSQTFKAVPDSGYRFKHWLLNGRITGEAQSSLTFDVTGEMTVVAVFEPVWLVFEGRSQAQRIDEIGGKRGEPVVLKETLSTVLIVNRNRFGETNAVLVSWGKGGAQAVPVAVSVDDSNRVSVKTDKAELPAAERNLWSLSIRDDGGKSLLIGTFDGAYRYDKSGVLSRVQQRASLNGAGLVPVEPSSSTGLLRLNQTAGDALNKADGDFPAMAAALRAQIKKLPAGVSAENLSGLLKNAAGE